MNLSGYDYTLYDLGFYSESQSLIEYEIFNISWIYDEIISLMLKEFDDYVPIKIIIRLNLTDSKEYKYEPKIFYDIAKNYKNYYSIKIQYKKK